MTAGPSPIAAAKARHSLAEVARRTGISLPASSAGSLTVRCPMPAHGHLDRTPSLRLHLAEGIWFCFACSPRKADGTPRGADVVDWVCATEGVNWRQAITLLDSDVSFRNAWAGATVGDGRAADPNIPLTPGRAERPELARTSPERIQEALDAAWAYYTRPHLRDRGVRYLGGRGIDVAVLERYTGRAEVGHTPANRTGLVSHLSVLGFSDDELVDAGLAHRRPGRGTVCDYYRRRVLIPVRDPDGRPAGFIGRNVGDPRWPKYKNPPLTHRYDKAVALYQPLPAPDHHGQVVVVEGTLDAMAIAVAAIVAGLGERYCPITQSGRELSPAQLSRVLAMSDGPPVFGFDGDLAGLDSNVRLACASAEMGREVLLTLLPDGHDPVSWLDLQGQGGLVAWSPAGRLARARFPVTPALAGGVVTRYLWSQMRESASRAGRPFDRTATLGHVLSVVAGPRIHLAGSAARRWAASVGEAIGHMAVAEARQHLLGLLDEGTCSPRDAYATDLEASSYPDAFVEQVVSWGRRLPRSACPAFVRGATIAVAAIQSEGNSILASRIQRGLFDRGADPAAETPSGREVTEAAALFL